MGQVVTTYAGSLKHFAAFLIPIHQSLPDAIRGSFHARGRAAEYAHSQGVTVNAGLPRGKPLIMCASYEDLRATKTPDVILVNHGVGLRYSDAPDHPSYSGGDGRERVVLHLCPSESDAEVCRATGAAAVAIGLPPYLDRFFVNGQPIPRQQRPWLDGRKPVVAWSHHADIHVVAETRWAFPEYKDSLIDLSRHTDELPFTLIGHAHPRSQSLMEKFWTRLGIEFVPDFSDVLDRADLYVTDNSSTLYEAAAVGIPVIALNAAHYRRNITQNLRFWSHVPGLQVDHPSELLSTITLALTDPPSARRMREEAVEVAYSKADGRTTERAVEAICQLTSG